MKRGDNKAILLFSVIIILGIVSAFYIFQRSIHFAGDSGSGSGAGEKKEECKPKWEGIDHYICCGGSQVKEEFGKKCCDYNKDGKDIYVSKYLCEENCGPSAKEKVCQLLSNPLPGEKCKIEEKCTILNEDAWDELSDAFNEVKKKCEKGFDFDWRSIPRGSGDAPSQGYLCIHFGSDPW